MNDVIFRTTLCPGCQMLDGALARSPVPEVPIVNIDNDLQAKEYVLSLGVKSVPVAIIDNMVINGASMIIRTLKAKYGRP